MTSNYNVRHNPVACTKIVDMDFVNSEKKTVNRKLSLQKREPYIKENLKLEFFDVMIEERVEDKDVVNIKSMILTRSDMSKLRDEIDHLLGL
ncbi:hypothetical protein [Halobacillus litoralis]|uniref:hypothetical protein n=1 Tax=Halobacillus litoralis TaxID=45668 RepID=UPI001CD7E84B|nr:hypothetical protein [Halobacillus litoralis]MCA1021584.1 hypothetical protein [Halobacillus litoralis]